MINYIIINLFSILAIGYILYKSRHAYHMLQLESYKSERYIKWMKNHKTVQIKELVLLLISILAIFKSKLGIYSNCI